MATKPKAPVDYNSKLYIGNEMAALDRKDRGYYDSMTPEEQKKFSTFLMIRWGSSVEANNADDRVVQAYYVQATNENLNKHFFALSKHPKLQWLLATTISPNKNKTRRHNWISNKKREGSENKMSKFLREIYPHLKEDEIELLRSINDKRDLKQLARDYGWDDARIKEYF